MLEHGFWSTFEQLVENLDPLGEKHALKVLELKHGVSQDEIRSRYRELTKKWHPDKFKDEEEKTAAHEKYVKFVMCLDNPYILVNSLLSDTLN